jgi:hypothetical protein
MQFKQDLTDLLVQEENKRFDEVASPVDSDFYFNKMLKLKNFRLLLHYYHDVDSMISLRE